VKLHQLLGYIDVNRHHVHFAEWRGGHYINPLRRGALTPYTDTTPPTIASLSSYNGAYHDLANATLSGTANITANIFDTPQIPSNWPWARVTPSWIDWRVIAPNGQSVKLGHWDLSHALCNKDPLTIFSPGDYANSKRGPGNYNYWLGHSWNTTFFPNGTYWLIVTASDIRSNTTTKITSFSVLNTVPPAPTKALSTSPA